MARKQRGITGSIETTTWSHGLEDDPYPHIVRELRRIADVLERLLRNAEVSP